MPYNFKFVVTWKYKPYIFSERDFERDRKRKPSVESTTTKKAKEATSDESESDNDV